MYWIDIRGGKIAGLGLLVTCQNRFGSKRVIVWYEAKFNVCIVNYIFGDFRVLNCSVNFLILPFDPVKIKHDRIDPKREWVKSPLLVPRS